MSQSFDELKESVRKAQAFSKQRVDRLTQVLNEYYVYKKESWLDLVDEAVIWAIIALSESDNASQCETLFFANVDELYVSTSEAERTLSVTERRRIQAEAGSLRKTIYFNVNAFLDEAWQRLQTMDESNAFAKAGLALNGILGMKTVERAPYDLNLELVAGICMLCTALKAVSLGVWEEVSLVSPFQRVEQLILQMYSLHSTP